MARPLRAQFKHGWYHITARGNNRQRIFYDERDRRHFLDLLGRMSDRHALEVHAYVLMDNHYHLLVCTPQANLSAVRGTAAHRLDASGLGASRRGNGLHRSWDGHRTLRAAASG